MKTIAITGAAGMVGTGLRPLLVRHGHKLKLLDIRSITDLAEHEAAFVVDINHQASLKAALDGCDAVLHLASCTTDAPWPDQVRLSIEGTISLFDAARDVGIGRIVYASTHHVVGLHTRNSPVDDHAILRPDSRYATGKAFGEALGALYAFKYGMRVLAIRIGNVNDQGRPPDRRRLGSWISWPDLAQLVGIGIEHPELVFEIVYGTSDATGRHYDNATAAALGYLPQDDPAAFEAQALEADPAPPAGSPAAAAPGEISLGGEFSAREFVGSATRLAAAPLRQLRG